MSTSKSDINQERKVDYLFELRPYTHKELHELYNVSWPTFQRWLKRAEPVIGKKIGHFYNVRQVLKIFKIYGIPQKVRLSPRELEDLLDAA